MTVLYLDSSAWVKRYYQERGSQRLHELLSGNEARACSVLGVIEIVATLARKVKAHEVTRENFESKLAEIEQDWRTFIQIELTLQTVNHARDVAAEFALRGADAVHFAALRLLQQSVSSSGHRVVLVASDRDCRTLPWPRESPSSIPRSTPQDERV